MATQTKTKHALEQLIDLWAAQVARRLKSESDDTVTSDPKNCADFGPRFRQQPSETFKSNTQRGDT